MADGLNIPGVSDKYKTNDLVESLMEVERIPLKREESNLETYKKQQDAWRGVNQKMSSLRDSVKSLYSFENPFSNRLSSSSENHPNSMENIIWFIQKWMSRRRIPQGLTPIW